MDKDLVQLLESSGFTEKEASVYLALLELGKGTVTDVSRLTGLKRSIIYVIVEGLIKRGYASELPDMKINTYRATDPSVILVQLKGVAKNFSEMLPILRTLGNTGKTRPKITYHETKEGILKMWDGMSDEDDVFYIYSCVRSEDHFPGITKRWLKGYDRKRHPIGNRHLIPNQTGEIGIAKDFSAAGERVRCLDELKDINMDFSLYRDRVAITSMEENPFVVVIESEELVRSIRPLFEIAWSKGKEIGK
jgi:sugar-specific transcriptional regulator TrmB